MSAPIMNGSKYRAEATGVVTLRNNAVGERTQGASRTVRSGGGLEQCLCRDE